MKVKKINIAIIGTGYMAREYIEVINNFSEINIKGCLGRSSKNIRYIKKKFPKIEIFKNLNELINKDVLDGIIVAVSEESTFEIARSLIKYKGIVLFEKPLGINFYEFIKIEKLQIKYKTKWYVGLNRRFYSSTENLIKFLKKETGKRIININDQEDIIVQTKAGKSEKIIENWMYANSVHLIDFIDILARGDLLCCSNIIPWDKGKSNFVSSILKFSSGDLVLYNAIWNAPSPWSITVQTKATFYSLSPIEKLIYQTNKSRELFEVPTEKIDLKYKPGLFKQVNEFLKCIKNEKNLLINVKNNKKTMKLIKQIYEV